ncbi:hypothetical protein, partial [Pseudofulvimonas gallinarii]|uniref:hypothetical protein n=1 Tax=Pseudofulvimonas gallinarii TaxID=634155 RepID=UPI001B382087
MQKSRFRSAISFSPTASTDDRPQAVAARIALALVIVPGTDSHQLSLALLWLDGVYVEATELPRHELRLHRAP